MQNADKKTGMGIFLSIPVKNYLVVVYFSIPTNSTSKMSAE